VRDTGEAQPQREASVRGLCVLAVGASGEAVLCSPSVERGGVVSLIGTVPYSPAAFRFMRQIAEAVSDEPDRTRRKILLNEAAVVHEFHKVFPGVVMVEDDDA